MRAEIVKRASVKERVVMDAGPASPAVVDVAIVAKPSSGKYPTPRTSCDAALKVHHHLPWHVSF
jgi:hypothetical protein